MANLVSTIAEGLSGPRGLCLSDCLPYGPMIDDTTLLLHEPLAFRPDRVAQRFGLGKMWRLQPINIDTIPDGNLEDLAQAMAAPIHQLPENCVLEFRMTIQAASSAPDWEQQRLGVSHETIDWQLAHIRQGMVHHIGAQENRLTRIDTYAGLRMPITLDHSGDVRREFMLSRGYGSSAKLRSRLLQLAQAEYNRFDALSRATETFFADMGLRPQVLDTEALLALTAASIAPGADYKPLYDPDLPVRDNITIEESRFDPKGFRSHDLEARVFSLRKVVGQSYTGMLSAPRKPPNLNLGLDLWDLASAYPLTLVAQLMMPNQQAVKRRLMARQNWAFLRRFSLSGGRRSDSSASEEALSAMNDKLAKGSEKAVLMGVHLIAWGEPGDARLIDSNIQFRGGALNLEFIEERMHGATMFGCALPLGRDPLFPHEMRHVKRARSITASDCVDYLPIWGSYVGNPVKPRHAHLLLNARNEAFTEDAFDHDQPHTGVFGSNRTGKSALMNRKINATVPLGDTWIVIDRHGSYQAACELHGGLHLRPAFDAPICFGPFDGPLDTAHLNRVAYYILEMCTEATDYSLSSLDNQEMAAVRKLLRDWADKREPHAGVATLGEFDHYLARHALAEFEPLCAKLRLLLSNFHGDGVYAPFIDGPNDIVLQPGLYSFDLYALDQAPQLLAVVTAILFDRVERFFTDPRYAYLPKHLAADEVSFMLKSPQAWTFIDRLVRTLARYKAAFYFITQQMSDLEGMIGKVIRNNCGRFYFFSLSPDEIRSVMTSLELPENWFPILNSVRRHQDCSECVVFDSEGESGIARIVSDPDFMIRIGQAEHHKRERERLEQGGADHD